MCLSVVYHGTRAEPACRARGNLSVSPSPPPREPREQAHAVSLGRMSVMDTRTITAITASMSEIAYAPAWSKLS
jgi:hypothetical protein